MTCSTAAERAALRRLGVFSGPFTVAAAEAVVAAFGDIDRYDVLDLVDHLADKSLVALDGVDPAGESRYRLLETIRYYALDRLDDAGELVAARDAHAEFWAGWAEAHNVHFDCSLTILDAIPPNLANLTAAARWACVNRPELLQALMLCIGPFVQFDDGEHRADGLFESALAALEGRRRHRLGARGDGRRVRPHLHLGGRARRGAAVAHRGAGDRTRPRAHSSEPRVVSPRS